MNNIDAGRSVVGHPDRGLLSSSALLFSAQVISAAGYFASVLILARGLGPEGRGTIAFVSVSALLIARVARIGIAEANAILAAQRPERRPALVANFALFSVMGGLLVGGAAALWLRSLGPASPAGVGDGELVAMAIGATAIAAGESGGMFLLGCRQFAKAAAINAVAAWCYAGLLALAWSGAALSVSSAAFLWAAALTIGATLSVSFSIRAGGLAAPDAGLLLDSIRLGSRLWAGSISSFLNLRIDQVLMGFISTKAVLGVYAVAVNVSEVLLYLPQALSDALLPTLAVSDPHARTERALRAVRVLTLATITSIAAMVLVGPILIPFVFGRDFDVSVAPFLWLLPGALGYGAMRIFSNALAMSAAPGRSSLAAVVSLVVGVSLDLLLIPPFGASGAALAASAAFVAGGASAIVLYRGRAPFEVRELLPARADLLMLGRQLVALRRRASPSRDRGSS